MKRIYKAINEGLKSQLIDFGNDKIQKSDNINLGLKDFNFGDYVYYDKKVGYNNAKIGKPIAVCIIGSDGKKYYPILRSYLIRHRRGGSSANINNIFKSYGWVWYGNVISIKNNKLHNDCIPDFKDGWENTQYILKNYKDYIMYTFWNQLRKDEYIPSINELKTMYNIYIQNKDLQFWNDITLPGSIYGPVYAWSSSQIPPNLLLKYIGVSSNYCAFGFNFANGKLCILNKTSDYYVTLFLHIEDD